MNQIAQNTNRQPLESMLQINQGSKKTFEGDS